MTADAPLSASRRRFAFALIVTGTVLGIAGTDLVLPAVPSLPAALHGSAEKAQLVLAAYVLGTSAGLILFGELGGRFERRRLLAASLMLFGLTSLMAAFVTSLDLLIVLRFLQGGFGSAPAVFAPGLVRRLYGDGKAVHALGRLGSIEALTPALAPVAGAYLLALGGWPTAFWLVGGLALLVAVAMLRHGAVLSAGDAAPAGGLGYGRLLRDRVFLRYALSQAFSLGALLIFVFGMPAVLTGPLGRGLSDFIVMQVVGIAAFILAANLSARLTARFGVEPVLGAGTALLAGALLAMLAYAAAGGREPWVLLPCFVLVNLGFGARGPAGFHRAIVASRGDEARGAALVVLGLLVTAAAGTAAAAPFITLGLVPLAAAAAFVGLAAVLALVALPRLDDEPRRQV